MSPFEIAELFDKGPQQSFRITTTGGESMTILRGRHALVINQELYVGVSERLDSEIPRRVRIVSIPTITAIEPVRIPKRPGSGRRRR